MAGGFGSQLNKKRVDMATEIEKAAERFGFAEGSQLEGDALSEYIAGLPPRATLLFSQYEAPTIVKKVAKRLKKSSKK